jgi:signal transduction histidine kinase
MTEPVRILHLEDDPADAELVRSLLEAELPCALTWSRSREEFVAGLARGICDIILTDFSLPGFDGFSALRLAREKLPEVPCLLVSGAIGEESAVEALKVGATDYVMKENLQRLVPAVRRALVEAAGARELRRLHTRVISAQETERERLARELHDGVGQMLTGIKFRLASLSKNIALSGQAEADILKVGKVLDRALSEIRRISHNLIPLELKDFGLESALRTLCREFPDPLGINVALKIGHISTAVSPDLALALFRIAQEALNNIGKHSRATTVAVALSRKGTKIVLRIADNGIGFTLGDNQPLTGRGIGLGNMRERAESVGGSIEIHSTPGIGTTIIVHAPLLDSEKPPRERAASRGSPDD